MSADSSVRARFVDLAPAEESFEHAVLHGLRATPKSIPSKFFYDERGSRLFEEICTLPEYYPTRTELAILQRHAADLAALVGEDAQLIEFGAGALEKVRILLAALERPAGFTALDISGDHLRQAAEELARDFPEVPVTAVCADYTRPFDLPEPIASDPRRRVGFFPGSTVGNFTPDEATAFLRTAKKTLGPAGLFIVGADLKKDPAILNAAYNDNAGVTAAFNLNLLARINRELGGTFDPERFAHRAFYNEARGRIEMHLESLADQTVTVAGETFAFRRGETIHTENSYKFSVDEFQTLARRAGYEPRAVFTDDAQLFSLHAIAVT